MKLTKAQSELLMKVLNGDGSCVEHYQPAKKLVALGLCEWNTGRFGSTWLTLTSTGRAALKEMGE